MTLSDSMQFLLNAMLGTAALGLIISLIPTDSPWRDAPVPLFWITISFVLSTKGIPMHAKQFLDLYIVAVFVWAAFVIGRNVVRVRRARALEKKQGQHLK